MPHGCPTTHVRAPSSLWLGFIWGAGAKHNPLLEGVGLPASVLVQTAFGMSGIELTPGLTSGSSCPEAVWQSALWWHAYYEKTSDVSGPAVATTRRDAKGAQPRLRAIVPIGKCVIRQSAAAVTAESR
jgi:hypothetical protein